MVRQIKAVQLKSKIKLYCTVLAFYRSHEKGSKGMTAQIAMAAAAVTPPSSFLLGHDIVIKNE